ncbi:hypothetical protein AVEN_195679-1 [Araneus ventricosus]|uniref:Transposase Tc1-like domain-containing protein n=1 Tax=Araneus ventricosus TaxID=182803 RepID=A0A4Y2B9H7_ARAVE|nr:hypothetical protein AVEN_195679-1 [Araneus ventricosus]
MSRRNHLHDEMRWRAVGMLQAGARQPAVARELNVHRSAIHRLWNHYQRDQNSSRRRGSGRRRITITADDRYLLQCAQRWRTLTERQLVSQHSAAAGRPIFHQTMSADCMKEDFTHDDLLFVCLCLQRTSERGCIGPVNIAVRHQNSGATYSLLMSRVVVESARSPDMNPIQHVWDMLGRRIAGRTVPPGTLQELQQALLQRWALLSQQAINDTIASMPHRCQACISARRYHTR